MTERVAEWLGTEGCRLEYKTHEAFANVDPSVVTGMGLYVPNAEGVPREIDVFASITREYGPSALGWNRVAHVALICECKYSKGVPWILLCHDKTPGGDLSALPHSHSLDDHVCNVAANNSLHFTMSPPFAHALTAFKADTSGRKDVAYDSLRKISDAAWDYAQRLYPPAHFLFVIPVLVVDGPLLRARFDPKDGGGKFVAEEVEYGRLSWRGSHDFTGVDVVQADHLSTYARVAVDSMRALHDGMAPFVGRRLG